MADGCIISGKYRGAKSFGRIPAGARAAGSNSKETHVKRTVGFAAICILLLGVSMRAQAPAAPPAPGPEVKRLAYFVGTWKTEGLAKMSSMGGPDGKVTSTDKTEWLPGGFFIVTHSDGVTPMGPDKELEVEGYDPRDKMYTYHSFDNTGETVAAKGAVSGDTWSWITDDVMMGPTPMKARVTIKEVSKTQFTFKMEISADGKAWTSIIETTSTKVMPAPAK
jgi:hypothetical protein